MATDRYHFDDQPKQKSGISGCLIGCLIASVVFIIVVVLVGWYVANNFRGWISAAGAVVIEQVIDQSEIPEEEKAQLKEQVRRVREGYANGDITDDQMGRLLTEFVESPLATLFIVQAVEAKYIKNSGLSEDEKAEAKIILQRFANGIVNKQIDQQAIEDALTPVSIRDAQGQQELKDTVTDEELRAFLSIAKDKADEAQVPEEVQPIDPSDEFDKVIEAALGNP